MLGLSRERRRLREAPASLLALWLACAAWLVVTAVQAEETKPYRIAVQVVYGQPPGPEALREEVEFSLIHAIATGRCFNEVTHYTGAGAPDGDLLLKVYLDEFREKTEHFVSQRAFQDPRAHPDVKQQIAVAFEAQVHFELLTTEAPARVRGRQYRQDEWYRPIMREDVRDAARRVLIEGVADKGRGFVCKGSARKLAKAIADAKPLE